MTRPHVVLDALLVRPQPTGVGRAILELTAALANSDRGLAFTVLATHPELFAHLHGAPHWTVLSCAGARGGTLRKALYTQIALPRLLRRLRADLLHCLQFVGPLRAPCPQVVTVHDLGYRHFPDTIEEPRLTYYRLLVPRTLGRAAAVVCNSAATAADVAATFPAVGARVAVTLFGTPSWVWRQPPTTRPRAADAPYLFVGTLEPRKNVEGLLAAYSRFRDARRAAGMPTPSLVLVGGRGWKDSALRARIEEFRHAGALTVHDYCDTAQLWGHYGAARGLLMPSLHEGFGFPILEAMAAGLPVVTADRGAMAEVAGDAALLVDPARPDAIAAAMARLVDEPALARDLARRGAARAREWTWERTAETTVAVYRRVLEGAAVGERLL